MYDKSRMEHFQRFQELAQKRNVQSFYDLDREYAAALFILSANDRLMNRAKETVGCNGIGFNTIGKGVSSGEHIAIDIAHSLFNGDAKVYMDELCCCIDEEMFFVCLTAMQIRKYGVLSIAERYFKDCEEK